MFPSKVVFLNISISIDSKNYYTVKLNASDAICLIFYVACSICPPNILNNLRVDDLLCGNYYNH